MISMKGSDYTAEIDWDKDGHPVEYVTATGSVKFVKDAIARKQLPTRLCGL